MKKKDLRDCYIPQIKNIARCTSVILFLFLCCTGNLFAQGRTISGVIVDNKGETIIGANVVEKGTTNGTITNIDGEFSLQVPAGAVLQISFIGYIPKDVPVGNNTILNITLEDDLALLDEVVVVGYGVQRKLSVSNAISSVGNQEIASRNSTNINQALQGKLPGLTIIDRGGAPGNESLTMRIRGVNSLNNDMNNPLVLIDGVPGDLSRINPNDIESVSVLKDAASSAIYGSRAAAGVILVTTKAPKEGKLQVTYDGYYGFARANNMPEHMDAVTYMIHQNHAYMNTYGQENFYTQDEITNWASNHARDPERYPEPNVWHKEMMKLAPQHNHNFSISGGSDKVTSRISLRYMDQAGIVDNFNFSITELRARNEFKLSRRLTLSSNIYASITNRLSPQSGDTNVFNRMSQNSQWGVPRYSDGSYGLSVDSFSPLVSVLETGKRTDKYTTLQGIFRGEFKIFNPLTLAGQYSSRIRFLERVTFANTYDVTDKLWPQRRTFNAMSNMTDRREWLQEDQLDLNLLYNKSFGIHGISGILGFSETQYKDNWVQGYRRDYYSNDMQALSMGANDASQTATGGNSQWGLRSFFGRINYDFNQKYMLELNARYDASSRFAKGNQWGFFPSASLAWRVSEEGFWDTMKATVNEFKLRGSWGSVGSQQIGLYSFMPTYSQQNYYYNNTLATGYRQISLANRNVSWETTTQTDIGFDTYLFDSKFNFTVDWYNKRTKDILLVVPIPTLMGLQATAQNAGIVENKGFEFIVGTRQKFGDFLVDLNINANYNQNKVIDLAGTGPHISAQGNSDYRTITTEGYPINSFYGYQTAGMFQTWEEVNNYAKWDGSVGPGDLKYVDQNGDGQLTVEDFVIFGSEIPDWTFSSNMGVGFRGFRLDLFWQGVAGSEKLMTGAIMEHGIWGGFAHKYFSDYWTENNPNSKNPRPTKLTMKNAQISDWNMLNGSYLRLKNIRLGYDIPKAICNQLSINSINVYLSATNLLTFSVLNRYNIDPEMEGRGQESSFPQTSVTTLGISINF